jgi:pimeloyl-ACP methyl ester carboxylesterase
MTTTSGTWTEEITELAGTKVQMVKGGSGHPLLVLHDEMGYPGWLGFHEELAKSHTLYIPSHAGFGGSERLDWIMGMRDLAGWYLEVLDDLGLGPVDVMGFSIGGWLAAEMAVMSPELFKKLILVGATGVRPPQGEIYDMFLVVAKEFITNCVSDPANTPEFQQICPEEPTPEQVETWEMAREEACRLSWRPYMHNPSLPHLLHRLKNLPTLVLGGRQDGIVPLSAAEAYQTAIPGSQLSIIDDCGHRPEVEKPGEFVKLVNQFLSAS